MWVRKRLDIGWRDLMAALGCALLPGQGGMAQRRLEQLWRTSRATPRGANTTCDGVVALSVRTAWDLWLQAMAFPRGSEIILSSITIPEMARIVELNGLVVVPVPVDPQTLAPDAAQIEQAISERTRAVLVAHLFGTRIDLSAVAEVARRHNVWLVEDCAQAYAGPTWTGSSAADVSLFSFGPIKTQTALGGALVALRDAAVREKMLDLAGGYRRQSRLSFAARVLKYACFKFLTLRLTYRLVAWLCSRRGRDLDVVVRQSVRNFGTDELLAAIRKRPSSPLVRLLARRVRRFDQNALGRRAARGRQLRDRLNGVAAIPGEATPDNVCWLFPMLSGETTSLIATLRQSGFDASRNHSLAVIEPTSGFASSPFDGVDDWLWRTVFLPCYAEMPENEIDRLAVCVLGATRAKLPSQRHMSSTNERTVIAH
jgi:dTDP-4-amino-4,6-dideoxygalactose transaminase